MDETNNLGGGRLKLTQPQMEVRLKLSLANVEITNRRLRRRHKLMPQGVADTIYIHAKWVKIGLNKGNLDKTAKPYPSKGYK